MEDVEQLALVLVDAFDLAVKDRVGIDDLARCRLEPVGECNLGLAFCEREIVRETLRPPPAAGDGAVARGRRPSLPRSCWVMSRDRNGLACCSQRLGVTPLVLLLKRAGNISAKSLSTRLRSSSEWIAATPLVLCEPTTARCAMRTFRTGPSSIRLMRCTRASIARIQAANVVEKAPIDLVDDLQVPRNQHLEQLDWPALQSLRKQRVIGVRQRAQGDVPGLIPGELRLIEKNTHQLGNGHGWVRVIHLDRDAIRQRRPVGVSAGESA